MNHLSVDFVVPSCDLWARIGRIRPILLCVTLSSLAVSGLALSGLGCSGRIDTSRRCPGPRCEDDLSDAGATDGSRPPGHGDEDAGSDGADAGSVPEQDAGAGLDTEARLGGDACFNGVDDDANDLTDCAEASCGESAYCCAGETRASCCTSSSSTLSIDFTTCEASLAADCSAEASAFGDPPSTIEESAFVPNGNRLTDAGLVLGAPVDATRRRVTLRATIAAPREGCEGDECVDAVVLGVSGAPAGDPERVTPDVAVMVRASRADYALMIAGEVVARWPLDTSDPRQYTLELAPDGQVTLEVDGVPDVVSATYLPRRDRRVVLYGRTHNREATVPPARATDVQVSTTGCDVPGALVRDAEPTAPWEAPEWTARTASSPSAVTTPGGQTLLAVELPDGVALLESDGAGGWTVLGDLATPALSPPANERYADPELVREADRYVLYVTHEGADGTRTIARAAGGPGFATTFDAPADVTLPEAAPALESPAVVDFLGRRLMAATAWVGGESRIVLLEASDSEGTSFDWAGGDLDASTHVQPGGLFAFDDDEVGDADLWVDGSSLLRLYYAGRRGTRWGIGLRVSGNGDAWRDPGDAGPVLAGSGESHDALGVRAPSVLVSGETLELFHTATDGVRPSVGRAVGSAP